MNKGLEALKYLKENKRRHWLENDKSNECLDIIETELKRLEEIDKVMFLNNQQTQKQDEILRIIISKRIDFDKLQRCANSYEYNAEVDIENNEEEITRQHITQEEYNTLEKMGLIY